MRKAAGPPGLRQTQRKTAEGLANDVHEELCSGNRCSRVAPPKALMRHVGTRRTPFRSLRCELADTRLEHARARAAAGAG